MPKFYDVSAAEVQGTRYLGTLLCVATEPKQRPGRCFHLKEGASRVMEFESKSYAVPKWSLRTLNCVLMGTVRMSEMARSKKVCQSVKAPDGQPQDVRMWEQWLGKVNNALECEWCGYQWRTASHQHQRLSGRALPTESVVIMSGMEMMSF